MKFTVKVENRLTLYFGQCKAILANAKPFVDQHKAIRSLVHRSRRIFK